MGLVDRVPAWTLNQACASGLQAVASAAQAIAAGDAEVVLAGGIESMSRMPYLSTPMMRGGATRPGTSRWLMRCTGTASDARCRACSWERRSSCWRVNTDHTRGVRWLRRGEPEACGRGERAGRFDAEIAPVQVAGAKGETTVATDEHPRPGTTIDALAQLPLVFPDVEGAPGIITARIVLRYHRRGCGGDRRGRRRRA